MTLMSDPILFTGHSARPSYTLEEIEAGLPSDPSAASGGTVITFPTLPGTPPAVMNTRTSTLTAAAQANRSDGWFDGIPTAEGKNDCVRTIATHPQFMRRASAPRGEWFPVVLAFRDAERHGADEAFEICLKWCEQGDNFTSEADVRTVWDSDKPDKGKRSTVGTLLAAAREDGVDLSQWRDAARAGLTAVVGSGPMPLTAIPPRLTPEAALDVMNRIFIFAHNWGGEPLIAHRQADGSVVAIDDRHMLQSLANRHVVIPTDKDKTALVPLGKWWLTHPDRREVDRVIFDPENVRSNPGEKAFNLWNGLARRAP